MMTDPDRAYDRYDQLEDAALTRLRDASDDRTNSKQTRHMSAANSRVCAIRFMLDHIETNYDGWETGWDDRHEDTYIPHGEMINHRRIQINDERVQFIIVEDGANSYCFVTSYSEGVSITSETKFVEMLTALHKGKEAFKELCLHSH